MSLIKGETGEWEVVLGLEVHAQVISEAKLFSGAPTAFGADPNTQVSLVDAAMPGMLPVINRECVAQAVRTGLGLKAQINHRSVFDRKNYFYPDLPQGYQISQYKSPIVGEGEVLVDLPEGESIRVGIERLHLEQDAGKSLHDQSPTMSFVDLNRSGVALMEIVSKPEMRSPEEAGAYMRKMRWSRVQTLAASVDNEPLRARLSDLARKFQSISDRLIRAIARRNGVTMTFDVAAFTQLTMAFAFMLIHNEMLAPDEQMDDDAMRAFYRDIITRYLG